MTAYDPQALQDMSRHKKIATDKSYVLGFAFDEALRHVVLLEKVKPAWAAGMWNGLGGKIEDGESAFDAMEREFEEECGVLIPKAQWKSLGAFQRPGWFVECFCARTDDIFWAKTREAEKVTVYPVHEFLSKTVLEEDLYSGLECAWLVPYARRFLLKPDMHNEFISSPVVAPEIQLQPTRPRGTRP